LGNEEKIMKKYILLTIFCLILAACQPGQAVVSNSKPRTDNTVATAQLPPAIQTVVQQTFTTSTPQPLPTATPNSVVAPATALQGSAQGSVTGKIPAFDHIVMIALENEDYEAIIGNPQMPNVNALAQQYVLLSNYFAVTHPSLPNYIALMSGDTQNIHSDCNDCFVNATNIADLITASGRTWKSYEEDMPSACFIGDSKLYAQKHNPLLYFDSVRLNTALCDKSIVPLTQLDSDLASSQLPNFSFVMPNLCNSGHDCAPDKSDTWIHDMVAKLQASPALGTNSLIVIVYDEGAKDNKGSCCGMGSKAGGKVAAILISPLAKPAFNDDTEYSHYSLLKTILTAWNLPALGMTQNPATLPIVAPWVQK